MLTYTYVIISDIKLVFYSSARYNMLQNYCSRYGAVYLLFMVFFILRLSAICLSRRLPCRKKSIKTYVLSILFPHVQHNGLHWHRLLKSIKMDVMTVCTVGKIMQLRPDCMYFVIRFCHLTL